MPGDRGDVHWFDLPEHDSEDQTVVGSEQAYRRPGVIIQNDNERAESPTTVIIPTTSGSAEDASYLTAVYIPSEETGLEEGSVALCTQIRVVDFGVREDGYISTLSNTKLREIEHALEVALALY